MKTKITFWKGVAISWRKEWERGDPWRIIQLAVWTVWLIPVHYLIAIKWAAHNAFFAAANSLARFAIVVIRALKGHTDWKK